MITKLDIFLKGNQIRKKKTKNNSNLDLKKQNFKNNN